MQPLDQVYGQLGPNAYRQEPCQVAFTRYLSPGVLDDSRQSEVYAALRWDLHHGDVKDIAILRADAKSTDDVATRYSPSEMWRLLNSEWKPKPSMLLAEWTLMDSREPKRLHLASLAVLMHENRDPDSKLLEGRIKKLEKTCPILRDALFDFVSMKTVKQPHAVSLLARQEPVLNAFKDLGIVITPAEYRAFVIDRCLNSQAAPGGRPWAVWITEDTVVYIDAKRKNQQYEDRARTVDLQRLAVLTKDGVKDFAFRNVPARCLEVWAGCCAGSELNSVSIAWLPDSKLPILKGPKIRELDLKASSEQMGSLAVCAQAVDGLKVLKVLLCGKRLKGREPLRLGHKLPGVKIHITGAKISGDVGP